MVKNPSQVIIILQIKFIHITKFSFLEYFTNPVAIMKAD